MKFNLFDLLLPRETKFYALMDKQAENLRDMANEYRSLIVALKGADSDAVLLSLVKLKSFEKNGDKIERQIVDELDKTFITPLDREDINLIAMRTDVAVDLIDALARKLEIYGVKDIPDFLSSLCDIQVCISEEYVKLIAALPTRKGVQEIIRLMHELEKRGDDIFQQAMADLFANSKDPIYIIKFKEIYEMSEDVIDAVDLVGRTIRGVMVKLG